MIIRTWIVIVLLLLAGRNSFSQESNYPFAPWRLLNYSGNVGVFGSYYDAYFGSNVEDYTGYGYGLTGTISATSYIYHPNFLTLRISGGYVPQNGEVFSTFIPEYSIEHSLLSCSINAEFFKSFDYTFSTYLDYNKKDIVDRFLDKVVTSKNWGAKYDYSDKYDISAKFNNTHRNDTDRSNDRELIMNATTLDGFISRSFFKKDINRLEWNINRTTSEFNGISSNTNNFMSARYAGQYYLDRKTSIPLNTGIVVSKQDGLGSMFSTSITESIIIPINEQWHFNNFNTLGRIKRDSELLNDLSSRVELGYKLYNSFGSRVTAQYSKRDQVNGVGLENVMISFNTNYRKKLPFIKGRFYVHYRFENQNQTRTSADSYLTIYDEGHTLQDGVIELLNSPNGIIESVIVRDVTGTIVYQENIDYILIQRGVNIEIQRLFGSLIENNGQVLIDYETIENSNYDFVGNGNELKSGIDFFGDLVNLEYEYSDRSYTFNTGNNELIGLESFIRKSYTANVRYKWLNMGVSYSNSISSIFSFKLLSYYLNFRSRISNKMNFIFNGRIDDYFMYYEEDETNKLVSLTSKFNYTLNSNSSLDLEADYSIRTGSYQNFEIFSVRSKFSKRINQLRFSLGVRYYNRKSQLEEKGTQYLGGTISVIRKF